MTAIEMERLDQLIEKARSVTMTDAEVSEQRKSFAYGNTAFENDRITRQMVNEEAERLGL
ncbi:hypothetical protein [uncultured Jannaschia sp.]|uniref:hypothetical protein n=1 Tax=uncultured Jannaschia sp. TaxID=293347 RepID=UPI00262BF101|nr:hypothetical protein [uncultured Jannaschia sp.]